MRRKRRHRLDGPPHAARRLRREQTRAETRLWHQLRNRQIEGCKFRRQHRVGPFIADFACLEVMLIVELDGDQHAWRQRQDMLRTRFLNYAGFEVRRFPNSAVFESLEGVLEEIRLACLARQAHRPR